MFKLLLHQFLLPVHCRFYEPFDSSVVIVKNNPHLEEPLNKVNLPFSLNLGKVHSVNGTGKNMKYCFCVALPFIN